jgi:hypothetical protein
VSWPRPPPHQRPLHPPRRAAAHAAAAAEFKAWKIYRSLDVEYVFVVFGGLIGYSSDDINKFLWMVRIGGGVYPDIREQDYLTPQGARARGWSHSTRRGACHHSARVCWCMLVACDACMHARAALAACAPAPQRSTQPTAATPVLSRRAGHFRIDAGGSPTMLRSLMYKLSYHE